MERNEEEEKRPNVEKGKGKKGARREGKKRRKRT